MNMKMMVIPVLALSAPLLMGESCVGSETAIEEPTKDVFCNEDVHVSAVVSNYRSTAVSTTGLLALYSVKDGKARILKRVSMEQGESIVLSDTIPWSFFESDRGGYFVLVADVGWVQGDVTTPGSTIGSETYGDVIRPGGLSLLARATRSFQICK